MMPAGWLRRRLMNDDIPINLSLVVLVDLVHAPDLVYFHFRSNWRTGWHLALETVSQPLVLLASNH